MEPWLGYSAIVILLWGVVGVLQKLGTNRINAESLMIWLMTGYLIMLFWMVNEIGISTLATRDLFIGILSGACNGLGAWFLFAALQNGAKASVAVPLTGLNPLLTILLAFVFLHERVTLTQWAGIALAVIAGAMISWENSEG